MRTRARPSVTRTVHRFSAVRAEKPSPHESLKGLVWVQMEKEKLSYMGDRLNLLEVDSKLNTMCSGYFSVSSSDF